MYATFRFLGAPTRYEIQVLVPGADGKPIRSIELPKSELAPIVLPFENELYIVMDRVVYRYIL